MKSQVLFLADKSIIDTSFIGLDSTPIAANTSQNNPKSFTANKFKPDNQPRADADCKLGVHTASTAFQDFPFMNSQPPQIPPILLSLWISLLTLIPFCLLKNVPFLLTKDMM